MYRVVKGRERGGKDNPLKREREREREQRQKNINLDFEGKKFETDKIFFFSFTQNRKGFLVGNFCIA